MKSVVLAAVKKEKDKQQQEQQQGDHNPLQQLKDENSGACSDSCAGNSSDIEMGTPGSTSNSIPTSASDTPSTTSASASASAESSSKWVIAREAVTNPNRPAHQLFISLRDSIKQHTLFNSKLVDQSKVSKMQRKMEEEDLLEKDKNNIILFKYATDPSYSRDSTPDEVWQAFRRRCAWQQHFYKMLLVTVLQIMLSLLALIGQNDAINYGTIVAAVTYLLILFVNVEHKTSSDLTKMVNKAIATIDRGCNCAGVGMLLMALLSPIFAIVYSFTVSFDFVMGNNKDLSYASMANKGVEMLVKLTSLSVGLRSGSVISAIQTFVGFEFIAQFDEALIAGVQIDMNCPVKVAHGHGIKNKMQRVRILSYILAIATMALTIGFTYTNECEVFCNSTD